MSRPAPQPPPLHSCQPATPEHPFIQGFNVHPRDFALIVEAAALHKVSLQDFVQLAAYSYARDWLHTYATATPDDEPPKSETRIAPPAFCVLGRRP